MLWFEQISCFSTAQERGNGENSTGFKALDVNALKLISFASDNELH